MAFQDGTQMLRTGDRYPREASAKATGSYPTHTYVRSRVDAE
jgi:hypothetical protein